MVCCDFGFVEVVLSGDDFEDNGDDWDEDDDNDDGDGNMFDGDDDDSDFFIDLANISFPFSTK